MFSEDVGRSRGFGGTGEAGGVIRERRRMDRVHCHVAKGIFGVKKVYGTVALVERKDVSL